MVNNRRDTYQIGILKQQTSTFLKTRVLKYRYWGRKYHLTFPW